MSPQNGMSLHQKEPTSLDSSTKLMISCKEKKHSDYFFVTLSPHSFTVDSKKEIITETENNETIRIHPDRDVHHYMRQRTAKQLPYSWRRAEQLGSDVGGGYR
jgi:hypothetical protein